MATVARRYWVVYVTVFVLSFGIIEDVASEESSWGQCSCPVSTTPDANDAKYSTITNATLCINAAGKKPICRIEVRCLRGGNGPNCEQNATERWNQSSMHKAIDVLTVSVFGDRTEPTNKLRGIYLPTFDKAIRTGEWQGLTECISAFLSRNVSEQSKSPAFGSWVSPLQNLTCVYTSAGWLHVVVYDKERKPLFGDISHVSYQFSHPKQQ